MRPLVLSAVASAVLLGIVTVCITVLVALGHAVPTWFEFVGAFLTGHATTAGTAAALTTGTPPASAQAAATPALHTPGAA